MGLLDLNINESIISPQVIRPDPGPGSGKGGGNLGTGTLGCGTPGSSCAGPPVHQKGIGSENE
ncbi:hypothetical protein [Cytobacillus purgationiresistens]|uniref:Uncharacterized protein n=1 Tax=Cytobacillus purgationiresistens TaxID=863449 RepID=A0ABU0AL01_9BACI|nr:hypothetical protein [Cytobacillus purgationiresistens]MDQ0271943.1 hypothetical protein [Cytobacillus purgationiresistens]